MSDSLETKGLSSLVTEAGRISQEAINTFGHLSPEQLNWKRSSAEWSIGQCFDHLIQTNSNYFPLLERIIAGAQPRTLWQRVPLLPGFFGRLLIRSVSPESARKLKAPKVFAPASSDIAGDIISQFARHQDELTRLMKATEGLSPERVVIPSPFSPLIIYRLLDGYRIMVTHERRHFLQAERVMAAEGFPRA
jgi:hypothetical protein